MVLFEYYKWILSHLTDCENVGQITWQSSMVDKISYIDQVGLKWFDQVM